MTEVLQTTFFYGCFMFSVFGATLMTYFLINWSYKHLNPDVISIFIYLQPVVATVVAVNVLDESISAAQIVCALTLFFGVYLTAKSSGKKIPNEKSSQG